MANEQDSPTAPLSWRDVYKAVGDSEERVIATIKEAVAPLERRSTDHEQRLRAVEIGGATAATLAAAVMSQDKRIEALEGSSQRQAGAFAFLSASQKFILLLIGVVSFFVSIVSFIRPALPA